MTKVWCSCTECAYNKDQRCKSKEIKLKRRNVPAVDGGRTNMWVCDGYMVSDEAMEIERQLKSLMEGADGKH